jgi:hypothetical protein
MISSVKIKKYYWGTHFIYTFKNERYPIFWQISFPADNENCNFLVICVRELANQFDQIDRLLLCATAPGHKPEIEEGKNRRQKQKESGPSSPNYLVMIPSVWLNTDAKELPDKIMMKPSLAAWRTLQHLIPPNNIYLVAGDRGQLQVVGNYFEKKSLSEF